MKFKKNYYKAIEFFTPIKKNRFNQYKIDGNEYLGVGDYINAEKCYKNMIDILPNNSEGYINLAFMFLEKNSINDAEFYIRKAIAIDDTNPDSLYILGRTLQKNNNLDQAADNFILAAKFCKDRELFLQLADAFFNLNKISEATQCLYGVLSIAPDDPGAKYLIDMLEGRVLPDRAPDHYVRNLFDANAESFDKVLIEELDYRVPQELFALLNEEVNLAAQQWSVLDLGCGTGLLGQLMAPYVDKLVGVDLSTNMLEKARARHLYTQLENAELVSMMCAESENSYDIAMAADVFVYVGKLDETFAEVKRVLKPHGFFVFSLQALEQILEVDAHKASYQDFRLNATFRYSHSAQYIEKLAEHNHFTIRKMISGELRKNAGIPVSGWYVLCESIK